MKKAIKIVAGMLAFVILFLSTFMAASWVFMPKDDSKREDAMVNYITMGYRGEVRNSLDVVFVGNSDMYHGFSPMELWRTKGIAAYTIGEPLQTPKMAYDRIKDMLRYQSPKLLVLEVDGTFSSSNTKKADRIPLPKKVKHTIKNFKENFKGIDDALGTAISFVFPLVKHHSRWNELTKNDFSNLKMAYHYVGKGFVIENRVKPYHGGMDYMAPSDEVDVISQVNQKYMDLIVNLCKKKGMELLLIEIPSASSWNYPKHNAIAQFADKNQLQFLDFNLLTDKIGFDWLTDTKDRGNHLNSHGADKVTAYLSNYIQKEYRLVNRHNDPIYSDWKSDLHEYDKNRKESADEQLQKMATSAQ